jgi:hypothetical protein
VQKLFYLSKDSKSVGPFSLDEILAKIENREFAWNDYLYDDIRQDWIMVLEYPALTEKFNSGWGRPDATPIVTPEFTFKSIENKLREKAWFALRDGNNYGPYSYLEVIQMLQEKTLFEYDFVWHHELPAWKRVAEISDFTPEVVKNLRESGDIGIAEIFFRRRHVRAQYGCSLILHDNKNVYKGHSVEISAGGAGVVVPTQQLHPGQNVFLHFQPGDGVPPFNAICAIVSKQFMKSPTGPQAVHVRYGVKFTSLSQNVKDSIKNFTERKTGTGIKVA